MRHVEYQIHKAIADYLTVSLTRGVWWTTFPAGGGGKARGARLKGIGLKIGVPDILIVHKGLAYWMEVKAPKGRVSLEQDAAHEDLWAAGSPTAIVRSVDDVIGTLKAWMIPHR